MKSTEFLKQYTENVLGLRYLPLEPVTAAAERLRTKLVVVDLPWPSGLGRVELFRKMMAAIGLEAEDIEIFEALPGEMGQHRERINELRAAGLPLLSFSPDLFKALGLPDEGPLSECTYGPRDLERNASLKREAWAVLQKFKMN